MKLLDISGWYIQTYALCTPRFTSRLRGTTLYNQIISVLWSYCRYDLISKTIFTNPILNITFGKKHHLVLSLQMNLAMEHLNFNEKTHYKFPFSTGTCWVRGYHKWCWVCARLHHLGTWGGFFNKKNQYIYFSIAK